MVTFTTSSERVKLGYYNAFYSMFVAFLTSFRVEALSMVDSLGTKTEIAITLYVGNIQSKETRGRMNRITSRISSLLYDWTHVDYMSDEGRQFARLNLRNDPLYTLLIVHKELPVRPRWSNEVSPCLLCRLIEDG